MYRSMRIKLLILLFLLIPCFYLVQVNALVEPTREFYVNDYANVLSPETEKYIIKKSNELNNADGTQIVVVTVPNLGGESIEDYSLALARKFKIGSKEKNNGLLLLLAISERESRIEVGTGLEDILPDGKTGRFQDTFMIPYFKKNDFDTGIKEGYNAFFNEIVNLNKLNLSTTNAKSGNSNDSYNSTVILRCMLLSGLGFLLGLVARFAEKIKTQMTTFYLIVGTIGSLILYTSKSTYFTYLIFHYISFLIARFIDFSSNGDYYGGGLGGGYSSSSNSSSRSSSGFSSGGGGSFSGGGSTRKF